MGDLDRGVLSRAQREKFTTVKTTRPMDAHQMLPSDDLGKYVDKQGKARFVGDPKGLRASQRLY